MSEQDGIPTARPTSVTDPFAPQDVLELQCVRGRYAGVARAMYDPARDALVGQITLCLDGRPVHIGPCYLPYTPIRQALITAARKTHGDNPDPAALGFVPAMQNMSAYQGKGNAPPVQPRRNVRGKTSVSTPGAVQRGKAKVTADTGVPANVRARTVDSGPGTASDVTPQQATQYQQPQPQPAPQQQPYPIQPGYDPYAGYGGGSGGFGGGGGYGPPEYPYQSGSPEQGYGYYGISPTGGGTIDYEAPPNFDDVPSQWQYQDAVDNAAEYSAAVDAADQAAEEAQVSGWWATIKKKASAVVHRVGAKQLFGVLERVVTNPNVMGVYPPLGITYAAMRKGAGLLSRAHKGDPAAQMQLQGIKATADAGDPEAMRAAEILAALYKAIKSGVDLERWAEVKEAETAESAAEVSGMPSTSWAQWG